MAWVPLSKREAFLRLQIARAAARPFSSASALGIRSPLKKASPSPIKLRGKMRQRREIAARADGAFLGNDRADAAIQHSRRGAR